jgi:hypothetical protein
MVPPKRPSLAALRCGWEPPIWRRRPRRSRGRPQTQRLLRNSPSMRGLPLPGHSRPPPHTGSDRRDHPDTCTFTTRMTNLGLSAVAKLCDQPRCLRQRLGSGMAKARPESKGYQLRGYPLADLSVLRQADTLRASDDLGPCPSRAWSPRGHGHPLPT